MSSDRLVDIFIDLVRIDGVCGQERDVAQYILNFLRGLGLPAFEDDARNHGGGNTGNIVCQVGSGGDRILLSHMDTARSTRSVNPIISNGVIKSDGSTVLGVDNRAGIAILLYAIEHTVRHNAVMRDMTFAFTVCEESTMDGARYLQLHPEIRMGFVFDSSLPPGHFIHGSCGAASFNITVYGKASHAGLHPEDGINAILIAAEALATTENGRRNNGTILNIGTIRGGTAINVVPDETVIKGEIRSMSTENAAEELDKLRQSFEKVASRQGGWLHFDYSWDFTPFYVDTHERAYLEAISVLKSIGLTPKPVVAWSGSDANVLNERGVPSVNFGIGAQNPHSNDECITINDLHTSAEIVQELMIKR